jgi:hypothetical protein
MKTMKNLVGLKSISTLLIAFVLVLGSCNKNDETTFTTSDIQNVSTEGALDSQQEETGDLAISALNIEDPSGRVEEDVRLNCATRTREISQDKSTGTVTINFSGTSAAGCTDPKGNIRKGKIIVSWTGGRWFLAGSAHTITFDGYSINGVVITGTRTVTNISTPNSPLTWTIVATHTATWPDGTSATRTVNRTRKWARSTNVVDDKVIISQTAGAASAASGKNRYSRNYTVQITTPLEFSASCLLTSKVYIPVKGVLAITVDTKLYTVDYGTGTCDNTFTVTYNGKTREFTAKNDSSND